MAKIINITNGTGTANMINDTYTVTSETIGYENTTITPSSVSIVEGTDSYAFTLIRTDSTGVEYGSSIITDNNGDAVFSNVPYAQTSAPTIYFKQTASDGDHEFISTVQNTSMTTETDTLEIQNPVGALRTISLTDANYANLPIESSTLTFTN